MLAKQTMAKIDGMIFSDQGAGFRKLLGKYMPLADDAYREYDPPFRAKLGGSIMGRECAREIWYSFRWTTKKQFDGRLLRLFNRGHLEEARFLAMLEMIGCEVWATTLGGGQFKVTGHDGHSGGTLDAIIRGIPECPTVALLGEFKTHNTKNFLKLKTEGLLRAKWEHYIQMQIYMGRQSLVGGLYLAVNKDTDELHGELVAFDAIAFARANERAAMIISAKTAPPRIGKDATWFKCKFCDQRGVCHGKVLPAVTCRSCVHVQVAEGGRWLCGLNGKVLTTEEQMVACPSYSLMVREFKSK